MKSKTSKTAHKFKPVTFSLDTNSLDQLRIASRVDGLTVSAHVRELIKLSSQPVVYIAYGKGNEALYVGLTEIGIRRPLDPTHHALAAPMRNGEVTRLECIPVETKEEGLKLERAKILELEPVLNKQRFAEMKMISVTLDEETITRLKDLAWRNKTSASGMVRKLVAEYKAVKSGNGWGM